MAKTIAPKNNFTVRNAPDAEVFTPTPRAFKDSDVQPITFTIEREVVDSKEGLIDSSGGSNYPSEKELQKSMQRGLEGKGTSEKTYAEMMEDLGQ